MKTVIVCESTTSEVLELAKQIDAEIVDKLQEGDWDLVVDLSQAIPLVRDQQGRRLSIDFDEDHMTYSRKQLRGKNEPIAKALGVGKGTKTVLDLSVGMAADSVLLSQLGLQVTGVERSPLLHFLLKRAFQNTQRKELQSYQLVHSDALEYLNSLNTSTEFDAVYFDPMYPKPEGKKTALPKQEMIIFRNLVGDDQDAGLVLKKLIEMGFPKIVVKRPVGGSLLGSEWGFKPSHSSETKVVRFDVYVRSTK